MSSYINTFPTRRPRSIKPMIIGLIIAVPAMALVAFIAAYYQSKQLQKAIPAIDQSAKFIMLVGSGQIAEAQKLCTDQITEQKLTDTTVAFEPWGTILDVNKYYGGHVHTDSDIEVQALIKFDRASKIFIGHWDATQSPVKLTSFEFKDPPTTQPASK